MEIIRITFDLILVVFIYLIRRHSIPEVPVLQFHLRIAILLAAEVILNTLDHVIAVLGGIPDHLDHVFQMINSSVHSEPLQVLLQLLRELLPRVQGVQQLDYRIDLPLEVLVVLEVLHGLEGVLALSLSLLRESFQFLDYRDLFLGQEPLKAALVSLSFIEDGRFL